VSQIRKRLTYANVMSSIAVFLVLGGATAFAATQLEKESVGANQLKKAAVTPAKLSKASKATLTGPQGPKGATGAQGIQGFKGETGAAGTAVAYAKVGETGDVDATQSLGVTSANVTLASTGVYCFSNLPFGVHHVVASSQFALVEVNVVVKAGGFGGCPASAQVGVESWNIETNAERNAPFYILFN
jgi:predicted Zn-dependent protease